MNAKVELGQPKVALRLQGETGRRVDAIVRNWILPAPGANPGMIEMMRLRDRTPPYEDPVPWAGEFIGKYLTSAIQLCRMTENRSIEEPIRKLIDEFIATQAEDGYLGPFHKDERLLGHWDLWGHYHAMMALYLWHRDTNNPVALDAACRAADLICATYLDTDRRIHDAGSAEMNMAVIHSLGILHRQTGEPRYLDMMREILEDWEKPPAGDYFRLAKEGLEFYTTPKPRWESLHPMLGLGEMFRITGEEEYRTALLHWWHSIRRTDVHNAGSFSTHEQAVGNPFQPGAIETCCTVAWIAYSVEALTLSGDSTVADALELATWNAVLGYQHPSGRWCTYDTPMDGKRLASAHSIVFQSRPGTPELNCCSVNGPRGLGMLSDWALLGGEQGLYLNYYGPGVIDTVLDNGAHWSFRQDTQYPAEGTIRIEVRPPDKVAMPLYLRIPEWSKETTVAVNGEPIAGVAPGAYLKIERTWTQGDVIGLSLDMRPRALRGDHHVAFKSSLYHGPLLLAYDQKFNSLEPGGLPALDLDTLELRPAEQAARFQPIALFEATAQDGQSLYLCDYATAGAHGTAYRSWLPAENAPPVPFQLSYPEDNGRLPLEEVTFQWTTAGADAVYDVAVARDAAFQDLAVEKKGLIETHAQIEGLEEGRPYFWQVTVHGPHGGGKSTNGPRSFQLDKAVASRTKGIVLRAPLGGSGAPAEGKLLEERDTKPASGRFGKKGKALRFNGTTSKLVFEAPGFPLRSYTFCAWICPENMSRADERWHQIASAWYAGSNDPLRLSIKRKRLGIYIEQPGGAPRVPEVLVQNGKWIHVAIVKEFQELRLYVDGALAASGTGPASLRSGAKVIGIGCNPLHTESESFEGAIAEVLFRREALSAEAIAAIHNGRDSTK